MSFEEKVSPQELRELLSYDADAGSFMWLKRPRKYFTSERLFLSWNSQYEGKAAFVGVNGKGYSSASIFKMKVQAHRVAWALVNGVWPKGEIDHINGNRTDNKISNLRDVTSSENSRNRSVPVVNKSGTIGVCRGRSKWRAYIHEGGRRINLGQFANLSDAIAARAIAEKRAGYHPNHGRVSPYAQAA